MIPPGFASKAVSAAADFEEALASLSKVIDEDPDDLRRQVNVIANTSYRSPIEALRELAILMDADYLTEEEK